MSIQAVNEDNILMILSYLKASNYSNVCVEFKNIAINKSAIIIQRNICKWRIALKTNIELDNCKTKYFICHFMPIRNRVWDLVDELSFLNERTVSELFHNIILNMETDCLVRMIDSGIDDVGYLDSFTQEYCVELFNLSYDIKMKIVEFNNCNTNDNIANLFHFMIHIIVNDRRIVNLGMVDFESEYVALNIINFNMPEIVGFMSRRIKYEFKRKGFNNAIKLMHDRAVEDVDYTSFKKLFHA
jgi:hypothetical protein